MEEQKKRSQFDPFCFVTMWLFGFVSVPAALIVSLILIWVIGWIFRAPGTTVIASILGFVGGVILACRNASDPLCEEEWIRNGKPVKFRRAMLYLLPSLATMAAFLLLAIFLTISFPSYWDALESGQDAKAVFTIFGWAEMAFWFPYWIGLCIHFGGLACDKCHTMCAYDILTKNYSHSTYEKEKWHSGSGVIGHVYDSDGNQVGDVKGDTSYTTKHTYSTSTTKYHCRCRYCGYETDKSISVTDRVS